VDGSGLAGADELLDDNSPTSTDEKRPADECGSKERQTTAVVSRSHKKFALSSFLESDRRCFFGLGQFLTSINIASHLQLR